jgi:hypothetical protein
MAASGRAGGRLGSWRGWAFCGFALWAPKWEDKEAALGSRSGDERGQSPPLPPTPSDLCHASQYCKGMETKTQMNLSWWESRNSRHDIASDFQHSSLASVCRCFILNAGRMRPYAGIHTRCSFCCKSPSQRNCIDCSCLLRRVCLSAGNTN